MERIQVYYDDQCGFCRRCARFLSKEPKYVAIELAPLSQAALPNLTIDRDELLVIADGTDVYRGADALILCLYALKRYRRWSMRFASPALKPLVRRAFERFSAHREGFSRLLGMQGSNEQVAATLREDPEPTCKDLVCGVGRLPLAVRMDQKSG